MKSYRLTFLIAALATTGIFAASAFNNANLGTRSVTAAVVNDNVAYLALQVRSASPHSCMVTPTTTAKVAISFADASSCTAGGTGTGINEGSWYEFDDLLEVTNQGTKTVYVFINATTTSGSSSLVLVAMKHGTTDGLGKMRDSDYVANAGGAGGMSLAVGEKAYVGIRVEAGTLTSGSQVTGTILVEGAGH